MTRKALSLQQPRLWRGQYALERTLLPWNDTPEQWTFYTWDADVMARIIRASRGATAAGISGTGMPPSVTVRGRDAADTVEALLLSVGCERRPTPDYMTVVRTGERLARARGRKPREVWRVVNWLNGR